MSNQLEVVYEDDTLRQGFSRNVHFVTWHDAPTADQMRAYGRTARDVHGRHSDGSGLFNIVVTGTPRFSNEVRELAMTYTREGLHSVGTAHVILVRGLLGSSARAFLGTTVLLGRPPNPTKVFADIESAAMWMAKNLAERGSQTWSSEELSRCAIQLLAR
ncbi:MAG: hypothetical protein AB8I08_15130 [Sandaracinaceae bacterium]